LNIAWKFQIPAFVLTDKTLSEGGFSFDYDIRKEIKDGVIPDPAQMMIDPATGQPMPGAMTGDLGAPVMEPEINAKIS
jgi:pyruvate/2-oxoacid:ferredoxin oxidoreductase alpha subunit